MEYARSRNFGFLEVSAKTGTNVRNSFSCLVKGKRVRVTRVEIYKASVQEAGGEVEAPEEKKIKLEQAEPEGSDRPTETGKKSKKKCCS